MAGLLDGFFGDAGGGIIGAPPGTGPGYENDMSIYGRNPGPGLRNLTGGGSPGLLSQMGYPEAGGMIDRFGQAFNNPMVQVGLALASGHTPQEGFGNVVKAQLQRQKNEQDKWPAAVKEYQYAVATGQFHGSYLDFVKQQQTANAKLGLNGIPLTNEAGEVAYGQLSNQPGGGMSLAKPPEGYFVSNKPIKQESATDTWFVDPQTRQVIPGTFKSKNVEEGAYQKKQGAETYTAVQRLPNIESTTERALNRLDALEKHPGMGASVGFIVGKSPIAPTPAARDFNARVEEIQGESWTQGIETMRGLGALSDAEGRRIEQARSRLSARDVSEEDYKKSIRDVADIMRTGRDNARKIASGKMKPYSVGEDKSNTPADSGGEWTTLPNGVKIRQK